MMARVMVTDRRSKRPSPSPEDSDEADAQRRVRVKKEHMDEPGPSRYVPNPRPVDSQVRETQNSQQADEDSSDEEEDEDEEDEVNLLEGIDNDRGAELWEAGNARKARYAGKIREAGVIKSVTLTNFMCHRHLTAEFGGKMNFLVGHNGSGKSAILTAIAVAFGGKTAQTGRGSSLKDLVMKQADKATISITLENKGSGAFEPETYNPYLVIERTIAGINGASGYKFRSTRDGKVLADKREVLTRIVDRFGLNIDSPLTVLTQDQARSFLQASDPGSLYKFFMKGTGLQDLGDSYTNIGHQIQIFKSIQKQEKETIKELQEHWEQLVRRNKEFELVLDKQRHKDRLLAEQAWAFVHVGEKELMEARNGGKEADQKLKQGQERLETEKTKVEQANEQLQELDKAINAMNENEAPVKAKKESQRKKVVEINGVIGELSNDIKKCEQAIALGVRDVEDFEAKIRKKDNADQGNDPEVARLRDLIQQHQALTARLRRQRPKIEDDITNAETALVRAEEAETIATNTRMAASQAEREQAQRIESLKAQSGNRLNAFGRRIDMVMSEIDRARWTASKPIGPLGLHVKLTDPRYKDAFHRYFGQILCQFAVRNDTDRRTMMDILKRCHAKGYFPGNMPHGKAGGLSVVQYSGDRFDIRDGDMSHINDTLLSKLEIDNIDVRNILVNAHAIERTFVWPQIKGPSGVTQRIRVLYDEGTRQCNFITSDGFTARGNNGRDSSGPLGPYRGNPLLTKDVAQDIEECRNEHGVLIQRRDEAIEALKAANAETRRRKDALGALRRELTKVSTGITKSEEKERQLADQLAEKEVVELGADLVELRNAAESRKRGEEGQLAELQAELSELEQKAQEMRELVQQTEAELEGLAPERTRTLEATTIVAQARLQAKNNVEWLTPRLVTYETRCAHARAVQKAKEEQLEEWLLQAGALGPRHETQRTPAEIGRDIKVTEAALLRAEQQTGQPRTEVLLKLTAAESRLNEAKTKVKQMTKLTQVLERAIVKRHAFWISERARSCVGATGSFSISMSKRNLEAKLQFDHDVGRMLIRVLEKGAQQVDANGAIITGPRQYKTPKTMSGGERSFTTVSLLLALWSLSSSPMRCLDEWDVFLDPANRSVAAAMLLEGARSSHETQFILITPQSMGGIEVNGPGNKVIRLADPERGQRTLSFQGQTQTQTQA